MRGWSAIRTPRTGRYTSVRLSTIRLEILAIRYRMANGLQKAMSLWTTFLIAWIVSVGLKDAPPLLQWGHEWGAGPHRWLIAFSIVGGLAIAVRPILRHGLRRYGQEPMETLPLTSWQRLQIDGAAVSLFMTPPLIVLTVVAASGGVALPAIVAIVSGLAVQTLTLGAPGATELRMRSRAVELRLPADLRWLLRSGRFAPSELLALACAIGARLAIANNGVSNPMSATRIDCFFGAIAAAILASAVTRARQAARHHRALETALPISSARRLARLCLSALPFAAPLLLTPLSAPLSVGVYLVLVLLGEHRSLREPRAARAVMGAGVATAVVSAVDVRAALVATLLLAPVMWRLALRSQERCDVPLLQSDIEP
jgi:hypothetical protein